MIGVIGHRGARSEPGRFVAHQTHAMSHKIENVAMRRSFHERFRFCQDVAAASSRLDVATCSHLNGIDFS